ncbi:phosphoenolpyruvate carboxykinase (ATP) [Echinicola vietnamensis]|uniref:Phosphoenolpyruvate carboxykinase (ATP) n=1 Tax=Echinicola vietnamensis (strain DSM 17526 / LMG 23754 / KMM 6221) TaxID=926556 RepID=L0G2X7_ECHVK|nr:phosphoenolpyruvate carboxykinase (ATP) [Echinicola vietnamensis]AGA79195.1 ATP-dependent phosphoenolpyruvate carboxykinase [Echinicola vietnamensis DSM 17526]
MISKTSPVTDQQRIHEQLDKGQLKLNLTPPELIEHALAQKEGWLTDTGALMADTGKFTGRSPKDRYIVSDYKTKNTIWWGTINIPFMEAHFDGLLNKMTAYLKNRIIFARDMYAGADSRYRLNVRVYNTLAWHNLFCHNMFLRPEEGETIDLETAYTIICIPEFEADPTVDGTRGKNFTIINLTRKIILIGGTGYAGEIKKGIFSVLNYLLPLKEKVLSMHCSANIGKMGDTAVFFGLSGTGKTTLSADPERKLIGDDEHGWTNNGIFNFEGGCYAKVIDLSEQKEPEIWRAIKFGSIVENTKFFPNSRTINFADSTTTENTRTAYPLYHIPQAIMPPLGTLPKNIFFLTADAFGVLPPISKLNPSQAMYHFISGYTAKVAGTEMGITEPQKTFSACFGAAFLPLHPTVYASLFGKKMKDHNANVWLVNTGWTGGSYGVGSRMKLSHTRAMISAALEGKLDNVNYKNHPVFNVAVPQRCPGVPQEILNPKDTWENPGEYDQKAFQLASSFVENFKKYEDFADEEIMAGAPTC